MKYFKVTIYISLLFLLLSSCTESNQTSDSQEKSNPNIIIILTDDQGYQDVGCYGAIGYETPHLDKLAREGSRFTSFYTPQAVCTASRAGMLTGCYPNRIGIHGAFFPKDGQGLNTDEITIAEMLKPLGYSTAIYGKWHLGDDTLFLPNKHGFDEFYGIPYSNDMWPYHPQQGTEFNFDPLPLISNNTTIDTLDDQSNLTKMITEKSVDFINKNSKSSFFLLVTHPQPHVPLFVSDAFRGKSEKGLYGDVIMELDWSVGEIMKSLKENNIEDNTLIIFTSDNGPWIAYGDHAGSADPFREGKSTAWEGGHRVPFIARFPGVIPENKIVDEPFMGIDLLPTIANLTGAELPKNKIDGKNAWPLITGESNKSPQTAYFFYYKVNELHGVRYGDWKLYFPHTYKTLNGRDGGKNGIPVSYDKGIIESIELYNLKNDICETKNVAAQNPEVVKEIIELADTMRSELGDALKGKNEGKGSRPIGRVAGTNSRPQE